MKRRLNLKNRLTLLFLAIGIVPLIIVGYVANMIAQDALETEYRSTMSAIITTKRDGIERYFAKVEAELALLAHDPRLVRASYELGDGYRRLVSEGRSKDFDMAESRRNLSKYYSGTFAADYKTNNGSPVQGLGSYVAALSDEGVLLQSEYIVRNSSPAGSKQLQDRGQDRSTYSAVHGEYHPYLRDFASKFEYDDIILIDLNSGEIVYSVNKDVDLGSNVLRGPNSKSSLGQAFRDLQKGDGSEAMVIGDFANYFSSYDRPEAFVGTTVAHNGRPGFGLFFQLNIEKINTLMAQTAGLGRTGESYLVGADFLMRSDARLDLKNHSVINSFLRPESGRLDTRPTREAIAGRKGVGYFRGYANYDVLAAYAPVPILNVRWALVAEISKEESKASQKKLASIVLMMTLLTAVLVTLVGSLVGRGIAVPILRIGKDLGDNSDEVGRAATDLLASSEQLSAMAEEQAESINETAASTDEIAAMVGNNVNQAAASAELSTEIKLTTDKVDASMEKLDKAMGEIRDSNVQIQELVTVISEIAEKTAVIDEIVFQTKLLSFNASVEAERAGEHGRGFAVVAQEVGNLAKMSGKASVEITSMVKDSVKKAEKISRVNSEKVALVGQSVAETELLLNKIGTDAERLLQQAQQILTSSKEQSEGIKQINEAMIQLEQATRQNSAAANSTAAASDELKAQSSHLTANVGALLRIVSEDAIAPPTPAKTMERVPPPPPLDNVRPLRGQKKKPVMDRSKRSYEPKIAVGGGSNESSEPAGSADSEWEKL